MMEFSFLGRLTQVLEINHFVKFQWTFSGVRWWRFTDSPAELVLRWRRHLLFHLNTCPSCRTSVWVGCSWQSKQLGGPQWPNVSVVCIEPSILPTFTWWNLKPTWTILLCLSQPACGELPRWLDERLVIGPGSGPRNSTTLGLKGRLESFH